jgi:hypothetical protein
VVLVEDVPVAGWGRGWSASGRSLRASVMKDVHRAAGV